MELGIIGLPTSGKTTVFNALTRSNRPTAAASMGKLELYNAVVDVPDGRVDILSEMYHPRKTIYAKVSYTDIAGLDQDLGTKGLPGELRNKIAPMDAFVQVVRAFEDPRVPHVAGSVNPQRDLDTFESELLLADMIAVESLLVRLHERLQKGARGDERKGLEANLALLDQFRDALNQGQPLRDLNLSPEAENSVRGFGLLTLKPMLVLLNTGEDPVNAAELVTTSHHKAATLALQGHLEMEISQLLPEEAQAFMEEFGITQLARERVIQASYGLVGLHSFFTVGEDEVRAWTIPVGSTALDAAGTIHTDLARGFIRAEVVAYHDLIEAGSMVVARKNAKVHIEGKEYVVQDADIVHIRFAV